VVYSGSRVLIYEFLRENVLKRDENGDFALWKGMLAGMSAGAMGQFVATPTDVLKVNLQMDGKRIAQGLKPQFNGFSHAAKTLSVRSYVPTCDPSATHVPPCATHVPPCATHVPPMCHPCATCSACFAPTCDGVWTREAPV
jgi:hypothetical protein